MNCCFTYSTKIDKNRQKYKIDKQTKIDKNKQKQTKINKIYKIENRQKQIKTDKINKNRKYNLQNFHKILLFEVL